MNAAIIGAGRMGSLILERLPMDVSVCIIDKDMEKAALAAQTAGVRAASDISACSDADVILLVLPAEVTADAAMEAAKAAKPGALLINLATNGVIPDTVRHACPQIRFIEAKIIGHAGAIRQGASGVVVVDTQDQRLLDTARTLLGGLGAVEAGDASLVPMLNTIGSTEGIRAAVACKKQLAALHLPQAWMDAVIATVCAGTMCAYVADDLGGFGRALAEQLERQE